MKRNCLIAITALLWGLFVVQLAFAGGIKDAIVGALVEHLVPLVLTLALGISGTLGIALLKTIDNAAIALEAIVKAAADKKFTYDECVDIRNKAMAIILPWKKTPETAGPAVLKNS